jgi:hypothetical protein
VKAHSHEEASRSARVRCRRMSQPGDEASYARAMQVRSILTMQVPLMSALTQV